MKKTYLTFHNQGQLKKQMAWISASLCCLMGLANPAQAQFAQVGIMPGLPNTPTIYQATGNINANFPSGISFPRLSGSNLVKQVSLTFAANPDNSATSSTSRITSLDGGLTWGAVSTPAAPFNDAGMTFRMLDNTLITFPYAYTNPFNNFLSTDNGTTFTASSQSLGASLHFHRSVLEEPNGDLYAIGYTGEQIRVMKRLAGTNAWTLLSIPMKGGADGDGGTYSEPTMERCADGSWLVVCRHDGPTKEMRWARSTDKGVTWTAHQAVVNIPIGSGYLIDVDPCLKLLPNGILVLTYGSRKSTPDWSYCDDKMAFSYDNGATWHNGQTVFSGTNSLGPPGTMTSGYTAAIPITAHRFMYIGDTGTSWTYNNVVHPSPNPYSIWGKYVDFVRTEQNRIDLKSKIAAGTATVMPATTLTLTDSNHPETGIGGPVDGSADYWSAAMATSGGVYQIDLQKSYRITNIGLAMLYGKQQSATVEYSADGSSWSPAGVSYTNQTHYALNYTDVTDFDARYIRVTVSGTGQVGLAELELYESSSTFENNAATITGDPQGIIPPGWTADGTSATQHGFSVQDGYGYQSSRALKMWDASSGWRAGIKKIVSASNTKTLDFKCRIANLPSGSSFNIPILGTVSGAENTVFWIAGFANSVTPTPTAADIKYYNGTSWIQIGTASLPVSGTVWSRVRLVTNRTTNTATLYINDVQQGTAFGMMSAPASTTNLTGFGFHSNGTMTAGEIVYFDDVNFYDPSAGGAQSGFAAVTQPQTMDATTSTFDTVAPADNAANPSAMAVTVYPNPATSVTSVKVTNTVKGKMTIELTNLYGKKLGSYNYDSNGGTFSADIPVQNLPTQTVYVVTVKHNGKIVQTKLLK